MKISMVWHAVRLHQVARSRRELFGLQVWRCQCGKVWLR